MKASIVLRPSESKRLIAKGVSRLPVTQNCLNQGRIFVGLGSTNAYVLEELLHIDIDKENFIAGFTDTHNNVTNSKARLSERVVVNGNPDKKSPQETLSNMTADDIFIKGGNALDPEGTVGVMVGSETGGTVGSYMGQVVAKGIQTLIPIGLEKTVHESIDQISKKIGTTALDKSRGVPVGMWPLHGRTITEIDALEELAKVEAFQIAAGGIGDGEGSVILGIKGPEEQVEQLLKIVDDIRGEPPLNPDGVYDPD